MAMPLRAVDDRDARDVVCDALRHGADKLGLRNHTVEVAEEPPDDPAALAEVMLAGGRQHIKLRIRDDFMAHSPEEQRHALAHELVHAHFQRLTEGVHDTVSTEIGGVAFRVFWRSFCADVEQVVDTLAALLAPMIPLTDWQTGNDYAVEQ